MDLRFTIATSFLASSHNITFLSILFVLFSVCFLNCNFEQQPHDIRSANQSKTQHIYNQQRELQIAYSWPPLVSLTTTSSSNNSTAGCLGPLVGPPIIGCLPPPLPSTSSASGGGGAKPKLMNSLVQSVKQQRLQIAQRYIIPPKPALPAKAAVKPTHETQNRKRSRAAFDARCVISCCC